MTRVAVSILNYNSAQSTIACVESLQAAQKYAGDTCELAVFISDNDSDQDDRAQLQAALGKASIVSLRFNDENLGFSAGHNRTLEAIFTDSSPDYVWLLNNDCLVSESALVALIDCAQKKPEVGVWGVTLLESDGKTIQCAGGCFYNSWVSSYRQHGRGKPLALLDQIQSVQYDYTAGASLFFPVATLQTGLHALPGAASDQSTTQQQWLNESLFLYFEELDLAKRLKPGFRMSWCKDALIVHRGGASTGTLGDKRTELAEFHSTLSALRFTRQYYPRKLWFMAPARFFSKCLLLVFRGELRLIGTMTRAYWFFLRRS